MTQEQKNILLKYICSMLPYGVIIEITYDSDFMEVSHNMKLDLDVLNDIIHSEDTFKPYLRPMSSMTEEEKREFELLGWRVDELDDNSPWPHYGSIESVLAGIDWLNAHHFDYRRLIHMGLALEAPEDMYI